MFLTPGGFFVIITKNLSIESSSPYTNLVPNSFTENINSSFIIRAYIINMKITLSEHKLSPIGCTCKHSHNTFS